MKQENEEAHAQYDRNKDVLGNMCCRPKKQMKKFLQQRHFNGRA